MMVIVGAGLLQAIFHFCHPTNTLKIL